MAETLFFESEYKGRGEQRGRMMERRAKGRVMQETLRREDADILSAMGLREGGRFILLYATSPVPYLNNVTSLDRPFRGRLKSLGDGEQILHLITNDDAAMPRV